MTETVQTITIPYVASDEDAATIATWQRLQACVERSAYAQAMDDDDRLRSEKELRDLLKARFKDHPLGSWAIHCATREGLKLRRQRPDGGAVFGGKAWLERRRKGLITSDDWHERRHRRPICIVGDRTYRGNRHLTISPDGLTATVGFLGQSVTLNLATMVGKQGKLVRAVAALTAAGEMAIGFSLSTNSITLTFEATDLRRLPPSTTLEDARRADREALGRRPRGRPRKDPMTHCKAGRIRPLPHDERPVHPEWRAAVPTMMTRMVGVDINPQWIGLSVVEILPGGDMRDPGQVRKLDHQLIHLDVPIDAPSEVLKTFMGQAAAIAVSLARKWHAATVVHEDGLGKLRWSKKSYGPKAMQTINHWSRNALIGGLTRRCALSGIKVSAVWCAYSTTIGNMCFDLPDACAAAAEIARRGIAAACGDKDRLPAVPRTVLTRPWKDGKVPEDVDEASKAGCWQEVHRANKAAHIDVRRPHPPLRAADPGILVHQGQGYAVRRQGSRKSGRLTIAAPITVRA